MARLKVVVVGYIEVCNLDNYGASTLEEAARNQLKWYKDGECSIEELISGTTDEEVTISVEW